MIDNVNPTTDRVKPAHAKTPLLLISRYFPPAGGIQVQRALSLARYLPENGFDVHVLTAKNPAVPTLDPSLLNLVPPGVRIHRTWTLEPPFQWRKKLWSRINSKPGNSEPETVEPRKSLKSRVSELVTRLLCPDPQVLWYPFALWKASQLIRKYRIEAILVTAPPFSAFLLLIVLKRRFPGLRAVADIRDEWLRYFVKEFAFRNNDYVEARAAQIELATVQAADLVISTTEITRQELVSRYPGEPQSKFGLVPNGYEPAVFSEFCSRRHDGEKLVFTYAGTVYKPCSPQTYLTALDSLPDAVARQIETRFVGRVAEEFDRTMFDGRKSSVQLLGFVPQNQAIALMEETDVLLLPWMDRFNIPGKLFEYLATGKPIFAIAETGSNIDQIIREAGAGWCVSPEDLPGLSRILRQIFDSRGQLPQARNWNAIKKFERPCLAAQYAREIRRVMGRTDPLAEVQVNRPTEDFFGSPGERQVVSQ